MTRRTTTRQPLVFRPQMWAVEIDAPAGADIVRFVPRDGFAGSGGDITLLGDPDAPAEVRAFVRIVDGDEVPEAARYVGSTVDYHVFELARPEVGEGPLTILAKAGYYPPDHRTPRVLTRARAAQEPLTTEQLEAIGELQNDGYTFRDF